MKDEIKALEAKLKHCPFCAGRAELVTTDEKEYWVKCTGCETEQGFTGEPKKAKVKWNTRVTVTEN